MKAKAISVRKGKATKANKKKIIAKKELPGYSLSFNKQTTITTTEIMHESGKNRLVSGTITNKLYVCQCAFGLYTGTVFIRNKFNSSTQFDYADGHYLCLDLFSAARVS